MRDHLSRRLTALALLAIAAAAVGAAHRWRAPRPPGFVRQIDWAGRGQWLRADLHAHTRFSDGSYSVDDIVDKARTFGCEVVAITDHADTDLTAATPAYHAAIAGARARVPEVTVLTGLEWNIPPGKGSDHATVLFPPGTADDQEALAAFKERFDDLHREGENPELADEALDWLSARAPVAGQRPLVFLNHPSRRVTQSADVLPWLRRWRSRYAGFVGFEGAPGHQAQVPLGAYGRAVKPIDRWDPVAASIGGVWDTLLAEGLDVWGGLASSDFHSPGNGDYWPCEFSTTHIYARDRSPAAVFEALAAGSFFGAHDRIVETAALTIAAPGLPRDALPGEVIRVPAGAALQVGLRVVPGAEERVLDATLIAVEGHGARVLATSEDLTADRMSVTVPVPPGGMAVRARGCHRPRDGAAACFYTNAVRVVADR